MAYRYWNYWSKLKKKKKELGNELEDPELKVWTTEFQTLYWISNMSNYWLHLNSYGNYLAKRDDFSEQNHL